MAVTGTALAYLWLAGYVTKAKPDCFTKAEKPHTQAPALSRCGLGGAAVDVAAVYKPG